jgi:hypothetical protein
MMKAEATLLCIPDISGFTRFMSTTDFELGAKVIPSLLNKIVYSNNIGLKISEIEGDAVLFYSTGKLPDLASLLEQCKRFHSEFYKQLISLRARYGKVSGAERIPEMLGLKIILHFGNEVGQVPVGKRIKLIGEDVITAHRLLKNDLEGDEYILFSNALLNEYSNQERSKVLKKEATKADSITDDDLGKVPFTFLPL